MGANNYNNKTLEDLSRSIDSDMKYIGTNFPLKIFPDAIQKLIHSSKATKGFQKDYLSAGILSVCATAIGNSVSLYNGSYKSKPILWIAIIGSRGTGKTHPLNFAKIPLEQKDNQKYIEYQSALQEFEQQAEKGKKPKYAKYILKDFTPEKLAESLQQNEKGILIFQDELMKWINSFDKYQKGGDQQMYLDLFNGNELTVDRVTKEPIRIAQTNVNILGGMQPEIVKQLANNNRGEDGFMDRILFVFPENLEPHLFTGEDLPEAHQENYNRLINNLLEAPQPIINTDDSNIELFKQWQHKKATQYFNDTVERSIQAKMETYVWRLALIIELMQQAVTEEFTSQLQNDSLEKAIKLVEYFRLNAFRVHDKIMTKNPLEDLSMNQQDLYKALPTDFKRADVLSFFDRFEVKGGAIARYLNRNDLFKNYKYGHYKKRY